MAPLGRVWGMCRRVTNKGESGFGKANDRVEAKEHCRIHPILLALLLFAQSCWKWRRRRRSLIKDLKRHARLAVA